MSPWTSEIPVDDNDGDQYAHRVHNECKQQIFGYQRKHQRCWGENLGHQEEEHNQ